MGNRQTAKQEGIIEQIKKTYPNMKLIDHNEFANLWHSEDFDISNPNRFYRNIQSKIEQSLIDFHYAFYKLPNSYKVKILSGRNFQDFMGTVKQSVDIMDKKQKDDEPDKLLSFMMYYNFFNIGMKGLIKSMPEDFQILLNEQMRPVLSLMQSIARFSNKKNSKKTPFVKAPKSMVKKGVVGETLL